jgi:N-acetylmuramoyl-L-alanine amidase
MMWRSRAFFAMDNSNVKQNIWDMRCRYLINKYFFILTAMIAACIPIASAHASINLKIEVDRQRETLVLNVPKASAAKIFTLQNPDRLVVDVPSISGRLGISLPGSYRGALVKNVRVGQFNPETTRIVFETSRPVSVISRGHDNGLAIAIAASGTKISADTSSEQAIVKKDKPVIVLDAGHGGQDPGTIGRYKSREKDIVLQYARVLQKKLLATGRYKVVMTREGDKFISLRGRVVAARNAKGDLFISLHADSAPERTARGLSVYTLSEKASDQEAAALAERENKVDIITGIDLSGEREDVADILISLAQRETNNLSATFADMLVAQMPKHGVPLLPNSHRFAGFAVLKAPDIPSVLVEIGFLSNAQEEKQLKSPAYQDKVASGIVSGINAYFAYRKEMDTQ